MIVSNTVDYIIVGAGAAGPVVASRLSEISDISVAIIEAGSENTSEISRSQGAFSSVWGTDMDWKYSTIKQKGLNSREIYHPRGKVIGGSTAINVGFWMRGMKSDYDNWEKLGAKGWNFDSAVEKFKLIEHTKKGTPEYRGRDGIITLEDIPVPTTLADVLLEGVEDSKLADIGDYNDLNPYSIDRVQTDFVDHIRTYPADYYLSDEIRKRDNLTILTNALVSRILFKGTRAIGLEYEKNGELKKLFARKEIILSAGAYNTPKILKLSGIGPKEELEKLNIPVIADVPGVGEHLQDHLSAAISVVSPVSSKDFYSSNALSEEAINEWLKFKTGPALYFAGADAGLIRTNGGPTFEITLAYTTNVGDNNSNFPTISDIKSRGGYTISILLVDPKSLGNVTLASANYQDAPIIDPRYLVNYEDIKNFIHAFRTFSRITQSEVLSTYTEAVYPSVEVTDKELEEYIRNTATTVYHPVGTARMGSLDDPMVVVDSELRVRGVEGLRVADASVMPNIIHGHTMAPTVFIGEMLGSILLQTYQKN
ncbi:hypothetical protein ATZ33_05940 [Enterococcus silesiacus]|uniref:Choline dehydrogenase n=1 Tax=Enterococcus silesiacus TaxID=332949 RepID=A0A0S3K9F7_9ENTE|nr:GMC family oxidoreductase N-terminal domain-containing protein [Enterococcus silesiacus]ALS00925.1 hypothetical protein ATZ33_05940 [Enterococcus silesiacus]OJG91672.1 choline dehydrogenase [Enterococcus silesiacus]